MMQRRMRFLCMGTKGTEKKIPSFDSIHFNVNMSPDRAVTLTTVINKAKLFYNAVKAWRNGEITATEAIKLSEMKRTTFYKFVKENRL